LGERLGQREGGLEAPGQLGRGEKPPALRGREPEGRELGWAGVEQGGDGHLPDHASGRWAEQIGEKGVIVGVAEGRSPRGGLRRREGDHERTASSAAWAK
jgi:hypothetical protein